MKTTNSDLNIEILGVNRMGDDSYNELVTGGNSLPWLQDTLSAGVWTQWRTVYRDVRILDAQNRLFDVFNLTTSDLAIPSNRDALKAVFLAAAQTTDSDQDALFDSWELQFFGNLEAKPDDDPDGDGAGNLTELAFGSAPLDPASRPNLSFSLLRSAPQRTLLLTFRQRAGGLFDFAVDISTDPAQWPPSPASAFLSLRNLRNLCDGTGAFEAAYTLGPPDTELPAGFLRVRALPRSTPASAVLSGATAVE